MDIKNTYIEDELEQPRGRGNSAFVRYSKVQTLTHDDRTDSPKFTNENDQDCFHRAISNVLSLSQICGLFPITGLRSKCVNDMKLKKTSFRFLYAYFVLISMFFMTCRGFDITFKLIGNIRFSSSFDKIIKEITDAAVSAVFYGTRLLSQLLFLKLCPKWISIQHEWRAMERKFDQFKCKRPKLRRKFIVISYLFLILAAVEHGFYLTTIKLSVTSNKEYKGDFTAKDWFLYYVYREHEYVVKFDCFYCVLYALFLMFMSRIGLFTWYFIDLFVMMVAIGISDRHKYLNKRLLEASEQELASMDWHEVRQCYAVLSTLVKKVDKEISGIIFLYYCCNIYFIYSLLMFINKPDLKEFPFAVLICYFGAFAILVGRAVCVTLTVARVNDECQVIGLILYNLPREHYNLEVHRLQHQIANDNLALTGYGFFSITRNFLLAVTGAILTFQYVV